MSSLLNCQALKEWDRDIRHCFENQVISDPTSLGL